MSQSSPDDMFVVVSVLIKLQASGLQLYQNRDPDAGVFSVNFAKIFKKSFLQNTSDGYFFFKSFCLNVSTPF